MIDALDHGDLAHGYAVGKAHRLAEWQHRKEQREFDIFVNRLRVRKWNREVKVEGGARLAAKRERQRQWAAAHHDRDGANATARAKRRKEHAEAKATIVCAGCGTQFPKPFRKGLAPTHCTPNCHARAKYRAKVEATGRSVRACKRRVS